MTSTKYLDLVATECSDTPATNFKDSYHVCFRLTKDWPPFKNELETVKFLCTDFWSVIYKKQIDNLRTNHHGVYVLQDSAFRYLLKISSGKQYLDSAPRVGI